MFIKSVLPILALLQASLALELAEVVRPGVLGGLSKRTVNAGGGFALSVETCPSTTTGCGLGGCCPTPLQCGALGTLFCCPDGADCSEALTADPVCADNTWGLWNNSGSYFCCYADQVGDTSGNCESDLTTLASSIQASLVIPANTSAASAGSTATGAATGHTGTAGQTAVTTTTGTATTTTGGGLLGKITSAVGSAIHNEAAGGYDLGVEVVMGVLGFVLSGFVAIF